MEWYFVLAIIFVGLVLVMASGIPVAFAFTAVNIIGVLVYWGGEGGLRQLTYTMWQSVASFQYMPIVMFILLGEFVFRSGMGMRAIDGIDRWLGKLPGRLGLLTVLVGTLFSTMSGSTMATTASLGRALAPEMQKRGYSNIITYGVIMGSGGLAMLIPPSNIAVLWASVAEVSIAKILMAGILPGLLIATMYATYVIGICAIKPSMAPAYEVKPIPFKDKVMESLKHVVPLGFIVFMITGLILLGITTPEEAAAMGVFAAIILCAVYRLLSWKLLKESFLNTVKSASMIFLILTGAKAFGQILAYSGAAKQLVASTSGLHLAPIVVIAGMMFVLLILGMFMSGLPMIVIAVPLFLPIVKSLGYDPVWFGLLFIVNIEVGTLSPPFGMGLFVMQGVAPKGTSFSEVVKASIPFLCIDIIAIAIIMAFPIIALWIPNMMSGK